MASVESVSPPTTIDEGSADYVASKPFLNALCWTAMSTFCASTAARDWKMRSRFRLFRPRGYFGTSVGIRVELHLVLVKQTDKRA